MYSFMSVQQYDNHLKVREQKETSFMTDVRDVHLEFRLAIYSTPCAFEKVTHFSGPQCLGS